MTRQANISPKNDPKKELDRQTQLQRQMRNGIGYVLAGLVVLWLFQTLILTPLALRATEISYSDFRQKLAAHQIIQVVIGDAYITGEMKNSTANATPANIPFRTAVIPASDSNLVPDLQQAGVEYSFAAPANPVGGILLAYVLPLVLLGGFWYFAMSRMRNAAGGGLGGIFSVGRSKATEVKAEDAGATFKDVGGADEAIGELQEIIQFLKTPEKFAKLGGHIPKGVLLVGPPGTGKTLLARATAGEAGVPFFETSGAEFVEMFVGVGAARVRDLFEKARQAAPAVIFIDEIDAIGQSRGGAMRFGTNDEREQTLNQLLAEIDGFNTNIGRPVIIMAASNRPEVLDQALMRPGRFDRQVTVGNPDLRGRTQILRIHSRNIKLAPEFDLEQAARITPGFSGADLENVMNEAALLAARRDAEAVTFNDFQAALERVVAGLEQRNRVLNEAERTTVAYHEAGHALVAELMPYGDPVSKISIVPHSRGALGYTMQMPTEDRYLLTFEELQDRISIMLGGRAAEKVVFNRISTGASDDIMRATELARRMVTEYGMSEKLGSVRYAGQQLRYLDGPVSENSELSPETRELIDSEVQRMITEQYERAQALLQSHRAPLETLSRQLLKEETVDGNAVKQALDGTLAVA